MELRLKIKEILQEKYGLFKTNLEHEYEEKIINTLSQGGLKDKKAWVTYNQVILELKNNLKDHLRVKELQYRLTDKENPNQVCLEVINGIKAMSPELERLYWKIKNFS